MKGKIYPLPEEALVEAVEATRKSFQDFSTKDNQNASEKEEDVTARAKADFPPVRQRLKFLEEKVRKTRDQSLPEEDSECQDGSNRQKVRFSDEEVALLEDLYAFTSRPSKVLRVKVASFLQLPPKTIRIWFQNRRAKAKKNEPSEQDFSVESKRPMTKNSLSLLEKWKQEEINLRKKKAEESMLPFVKTLKMSGGNFQEVRMEFEFNQSTTSKSDTWGKRNRSEEEPVITATEVNEGKKLCKRKSSVPIRKSGSEINEAQPNSLPSLLSAASEVPKEMNCDTTTPESLIDEQVIEAIKNGRKELVVSFLNKIQGKVNVNYFRMNKLPLLHLATLTRQREVCKLLIKAGADVQLRDFRGNTALDIAQFQNFTEILEVLRPSSSHQPNGNSTTTYPSTPSTFTSQPLLSLFSQPSSSSTPLSSLSTSSRQLSLPPLKVAGKMASGGGRDFSFAESRPLLPSLSSLLRYDSNLISFDLPPLNN